MQWGAFQAGDDEVQRLMAQGAYRQALEALVRSYQHLIVRHCTAMLGDAAHGEEMAQEVFLGAYAAMPRFRREASVRTWLLAIARKHCLKALRDGWKRSSDTRSQAAPIAPRRTRPRKIRKRCGSGCGRGWID
jgi:RNA polymerase sigma factor (sigma-70 family)